MDKDLWGDADRIYGGKGDMTGIQKIYGGDGDDYVSAGHSWLENEIYLGNGDDTVFAAQES